MPDIAMCKNKACPKRETCYRFTATPSYRQSYVLGLAPGSDGVCRMYWPSEPKQVEGS
jgi:hypothetical protein